MHKSYLHNFIHCLSGNCGYLDVLLMSLKDVSDGLLTALCTKGSDERSPSL